MDDDGRKAKYHSPAERLIDEDFNKDIACVSGVVVCFVGLISIITQNHKCSDAANSMLTAPVRPVSSSMQEKDRAPLSDYLK